jgi:hypothetical protein
MKKLIIFILSVVSFTAFGQTPTNVRGELRQIYKVGASNDTTKQKFSGDSALWETTQSMFKFNKQVHAPLMLINLDTVSTKAYARSLIGTETDPVWTNAIPYYPTKVTFEDSIAALRGDIGTGSSQWTTTPLGIRYDGGGGDSICIDNDGGMRSYINGLLIYSRSVSGVYTTYEDADNFSQLSAADLVFITNNGTSSQLGRNSLSLNNETDTTEITPASIRTTGLIYSNTPHCALYRNTDLTITATQNIWYKITGFTTKDADYMVVQGDSVQFTYAGSYLINFTTSFSGLNNEVWQIGVFKGGTLEEPAQPRYTGTSDVGNVTCPVYISVTAGQWISFRIRNTTDSDDPTIKSFSAIISPIHLAL